MLKIVVPIHASGCKEDDDEHEILAKMCRNYGNSHLLEDFHACPVRGIDEKNSLLYCPFSGRMYMNCTEVTAMDWHGIVCLKKADGS